MRVPFRQTGRTVLVGSGVVILLIVLGTLQYSWIDRVSEVERDRRQNQLAEAALRFSRDFDSELSRLFFFFQRSAFQWPQLETGIGNSYQRWKEDQAYGDLLKEIWRIELENEAGGLGKPSLFEPATSTFNEREWPSHLTSTRTRLEGGLRGSSFFSERGFGPFDGMVPAVLIPGGQPGSRGRRSRSPRPSSLLILVLDEQFIGEIFLPELAGRHFGIESSNEFRLWVRDRASGIVHLEWPDPQDHALPIQPDVTQPLSVLQNRRDFAPGPGGPRRSRRGRPPAPPREQIRTPREAGEWELLAVHRAGSLETAVRQVKRQNLLVTTVILFILAASVLVSLVSAQRARDLARQQMDFVASVSHELRTPLTAIRSAAQNLKDGIVSDSSQISEYGRIIEKAESRLSAMVLQVLNFARSQATGPIEPVESIALAPRGHAVIDELSDSILPGSSQIEVRIPEPLPPVRAGRNGLRRVLENLIQNSVKYSTPPVTIEIEALAEGRYVRIGVHDQGPGIDASDLRHIFEPFFRGKNVQHSQVQGSGLGLSLVKRIVESFGGNVRAESEAERGTTFWISLERADGEQA